MNNKVLLTGAGFSYNFGFPLASEVWQKLFNRISRYDELRQMMLENNNYEKLYHDVLENTNEKFTDERKHFLDAIDKIFNIEFEKIRIHAFPYKPVHDICFKSLIRFLSLFKSLFTTNQDLFLEALYLQENKALYSPGMDYPIRNHAPNGNQYALTNINFKKLGEYKDCVLPASEEELKSKLEYHSDPSYYKLHGSILWNNSITSNSLPLVMGNDKLEKIQSQPLFKYYFDKFKEIISIKATRLLIIGYSFSDTHINELIIDAIQKTGLQLHIITPLSINSFIEEIKKNAPDSWKQIYSGLHGFYKASLKDLFPIDNQIPDSNVVRNELRENFES